MEEKEKLRQEALDILLRRLPNATLRSNLLLMAVAGTSPEVFIPMVETFFDKKFEINPGNIIVQKNIPSTLGNKEIFIDISGESKNNEKIVLEVENGIFNPTRIRYYTSSVTVEAGKYGIDYEDMPSLYMAIIEKGGIYKDIPQCFEQSFYVNNFIEEEIPEDTVFLPVKNKQVITHINADFKAEEYNTDLLRYIHDFNCVNPKDCFIPELAEAMDKVKFNAKERLSDMLYSYQGMTDMVLTEEQYNYAMMQGRKEEKLNVLQKLIDAGCIKRKDIEKVFKGEKIEGINFSNNISR